MVKHSYVELSMLFGMFIGSGIGVTAFASTNNALFFTVPGFGVIFGLGLVSCQSCKVVRDIMYALHN